MKKEYNLEQRTTTFARDCRRFVRNLKGDIGNLEDGKQLIRSSGSTAANYFEANESLGHKDFIMRLKISRKEAKESWLWLSLISTNDPSTETTRINLMAEADQLRKIMSAIILKFEPRNGANTK